MSRLLAAAGLAVIGFLAPLCAQATTITGTVTGTISSGTDDYGYLSGTAGTDLTGTSISVTVTYDPSLLTFNTGGGQEYTSNPQPGSVTVSATLGLPGGPQTFTATQSDTSGSSGLQSDNGAPPGDQRLLAFANDNAAYNSGNNNLYYITLWMDVTGAWSAGALDSQAAFTTLFQNVLTSPGYDNIQFETNSGTYEYFTFTADEPPPVDTPEPASLVLLGAGLGGLTYLRRKRR